MSKRTMQLLILLGAMTLSTGVSADNTPQTASCKPESLPKLPDVRITSVKLETEGTPHCKVTGVIGTETNFELLLPDDWNGKFVFGGGGGFVGSVVNTALGYGPLQKGFATVGTDTGHRGSAIDASWALNNLERIVSFGHQAVHRTTVTAKSLIAHYYGQDISSSLFFGCSRGGGQALMEAQRYPDDFDGIVAGAPAYNWTEELGGRNTLINQAMFPNPNDLSVATITPQARKLIGNAVLQQCDSLDGLQDEVLNNPLDCDFEVARLACKAGESDGCLTPAQLQAARRVYEGLILDGEQVVPGYVPGAELGAAGWERWVAGGFDVLDLSEFQRGVEPDPDYPDPETPNAHFAFGNGVMKYLVFHDPDWDYSSYDFSNFRSDIAAVSSTLDATDPNLDAFRARGGKLLLFNGWRDMALTPLGTIEYYENVIERDASAADDVRLIMLPGMDHCLGGPGPSFVNWLDEIDRWVDTGQAPDQLTAYWVDEQMQPDGSRPVCAYPKYLKYNGSGDTRDASSFSCVASD
ncbi:MAG: tannase/feruloyl esterase family alpha/beta hydrolase [Thiotrichales bacterium]|nr:MAG: tannase/feruloyl esterase family alpha/beta hydrolase [Thiotrichales bacterium]